MLTGKQIEEKLEQQRMKLKGSHDTYQDADLMRNLALWQIAAELDDIRFHLKRLAELWLGRT